MARKRSRKRRKRRRHGNAPPVAPPPKASAVAEEDAERASLARGRARPGPPPPPWGSFPLSELVIFIGIVLLIGGFFVAPPRGAVMLGAGLTLASLGGLELAVREHFAGYRSHTLVLAGAVGIAVLGGLLALTEFSPAICAGAAAVGFGLSAWLLAIAFRDRSGGALFRVKG